MAISSNGFLSNTLTAPSVGHASWDSTGYLDYTGSFVPSTTNSSIIVVYIHVAQATNNNILSSHLRAWFGSTELTLSQLAGQNYAMGAQGGIKTFYAYLNLPATGTQTFTLRLANENSCGGSYFYYQVSAFKGTSGVTTTSAWNGGYAYSNKQPFTYITNTSTSTMPLLTVITSNNADNATTPSASTGQSRTAIDTAYAIYKTDFALDYFTPPSSTNYAWWGYNPGGTIDYVWAAASLPLLDGSNRSYPTSTTDNIGIQKRTIGYTRTEMYEAPNAVTLPSRTIGIADGSIVSLADVALPGNRVLLPAIGDNGRKDLAVKKLSTLIDNDYRGDLTIQSILNLDGLDTTTIDAWDDGTISQWNDKNSYGLENKFKYSEQLDNAYWTKVNLTTTANTIETTDPLGGFTAEKFLENSTGTTAFYIYPPNFSLTAGTGRLSFYIKPIGTQRKFYAYLASTAASSAACCFDTTDLSVIKELPYTHSATITSVENGWFRCTLEGIISSSVADIRPAIFTSDNVTGAVTHAGNLNNGMYLWGLQLNRKINSLDYVRTTSEPILSGLNFTQSTTAERPFLTRGDNLENIIKGSESIGDSTYYDYVRSAVVGSGPTPPTGYSTSAEIKEDGTAAQNHYFQLDTNNNLDISIGASYTISFIAKANTRNRCAIAQGGGGSTYWDYRVDLSNGTSWGSTTGGSTARSIESLGNGWYKISVTFTCSASYRGYGFYIMINDNSGGLTHNGDNTSSIYFTGLQVRRNWTSSDYIATTTYPVYAGFLTNPDNRLENRILFSNDISATQWSTFNTRKFGTNTFYETSTSPSVTERHYVYFNRTEVTNPITISLEARSIGGRRLGVGHQGDICVFDLQNNSIVSSFGSATISALNDGWSSITIRNFRTTPNNSTLLIYSIHQSGTTWSTQQIFVGDSTKGIEFRNVHVRIPSSSDTYVETTDTPVYAYKKVPYFPRYGSHLLASTTTNLNFMTANNSLYITGKLDCNSVDSEPHYFMDNHSGTASGITLSYEAAGDLRLYTYDGSGHYISNSTTENNHPYLFSFIKSGTYGTHHLNSRTVGTPGAIASATASTSFIKLGTTVAKIYGFRGYMPNVVAYPNALNSSEHTVKTNYLRSLLGVDDKKSEIPMTEIETERSQDLIVTFLPKFNVSFGAIADYPGYYQNSDGFLNTTKYLQDSDYYQQFAYELRCGEPLNAYEKMMKKLLHPVGYKMFGEFKEEVIVDNNSTAELEIDNEQGSKILWLDGLDYTTMTVWEDGTISEWRDKSSTAAENYFVQSNDVSTSWSSNQVTRPNMTDVYEASGTSEKYIYQNISVQSGVSYTLSVSAKAINGRYGIALRIRGSGFKLAYFDLQNGLLGTIESGATASIQPDVARGTGWYKCTITWTSDSTTTAAQVIYIAEGDYDSSVVGDTSKGVQLADMQFRRTATPAAFIRTTTAQVFSGGGNNFTQSTTSARPYLTRSDNLENRIKYSEELNQSSTWSLVNTTVEADIVTSPIGTATGDKLKETSATGDHNIAQNFEVVDGMTYVYSIYAKAGERNFLRLRWSNEGFPDSHYAFFNLSTGLVHTMNGSEMIAYMEDAGSGWYKCYIILRSDDSHNSAYVQMSVSTDGSTLNYAGTTGNGIYLWGAQCRRHFTDDEYLITTSYPKFAGLNGKSVPYFPNTSRYMSCAASSQLNISSNRNNSIYTVTGFDGGRSGNSNSFTILQNRNAPTNTTGMHWRYDVNSDKVRFSTFSGVSSNLDSNTYGPEATIGNSKLFSFVKSGTTWTHYVNNTHDGSSSSMVDATFSDTAMSLGGTGGDGLRGYMSELVLYNVPSITTSHSDISQELITKHSITESNPNVLWLDGADTDTILTSGDGSIYAWLDKSGYGNHFVQSTTANRPYLTRSDSLENRIKNSEDISAWDNNNETTALSALEFKESDAVSTHYRGQSIETVKGTTYTIATSVKRGTGSRNAMLIIFWQGGSNTRVYIDLSNGTAATTGTTTAWVTEPTVTADGDYYRVTGTATAPSSGAGSIAVYTVSGATTTNYDGDNSSSIFSTKAHFARTGKGYIQTTTYPIYAGLNGRAVPYFPGAASYMSRAFTAALDIGVGDNTLFAVVALDGAVDAANNFYIMDSETFQTRGMCWRFAGATKYNYIRTSQAAAYSEAIAETAAGLGTLQLWGFSKSGTTLKHFLNGASDGADDSLANAVTSSTNALTIGRADQSLRGYLNEMKIYNIASSTTNILTESTELMTKWSIS